MSTNDVNKPFYKKFWFITSLTILVTITLFALGGSNNKTSDFKKESKSSESKMKEETTSITGTWYNEGPYGEVELRILNPDNFIMILPTEERFMGKWEKSYGDSYNMNFNDGSTIEATLNGKILDFQNADWHKN